MNTKNKSLYKFHLPTSIKLSLIAISVIFLLYSCGIIKYVDKINKITSEKEVIFYNSKQKFIYKNSGIYIPVIIYGVKDTLMFDTGYTTVFTENSYDSSYQLITVLPF